MPLNCSTLGFRVPHLPGQQTKVPDTTKLTSTTYVGTCFPTTLRKKLHQNKSFHIVSQSKFNQNYSPYSPVMEDQREVVVSPAGQETYAQELDVAVRAVQMACSLCQNVPHTTSVLADWSVQVIVSWILCESFGCLNVSILAKEDVQSLSTADATGMLDTVVKTVNECLTEAPHFGIKGPERPLGSSDVLEAISHCNSTGGHIGRFWALGSVRGDPYSVSLALIDGGEVVLGVLGCPNYPMKKEWLAYQLRYHRILSKLAPATSESWDKGCVIYARKGSGKAWIQPLHQKNKLLTRPNSANSVQVSLIDNPGLATFCDPVEKSNSTHSFTAGLSHNHGLRKQPLRVYNTEKYVAIARGDAEIFMTFTRTGNKEKIWDHAAGVLIIQEAGGVVTDAGGSPLDFSKGMFIEGLDRGIIASAGAKLHEEIINAIDASWNSSNL
ncbi:PAP-specific phosphatase HAL2-like [Hibiscus syriacus]|uniref:3'(2'),5'-bisphosphate nucleotidase n=1 Tax=Hibiscus syriacus TaxID=106335 RepID=A0A6A3BFT9_HIBSY|nr:PAP-specific phosphatase HAL2-like [Hibiscus syriacus]KAE8714947.1 PAP-specific phosphatase HAL2-like [Hibiscus syriacus]